MYRIFTQCGVRCFYPWLLHAEEKVKQFLTSHNIKGKKPKLKDCSHKWTMVCERRQRTFFFSIDQVEKGIEPPSDLVSACNLLGEVKNFQDECVQVVAITIFSLKFSSVKKLILIELNQKCDTSKGTCEKRFSGFCPLRGYPPPPTL